MAKEYPETAEKRIIETIDVLKGLGLDENEILNLVSSKLNVKEPGETCIPISVFNNDKLSCLETIVKYLRENLLLGFRQIGELTGRNQIALNVTYRNAKKKQEQKFQEIKSAYNIPVSILKNRKRSVLENIAAYLKDTFGLSYHNIAVLLNRDDRTIWTVYQRAMKKK